MATISTPKVHEPLEKREGGYLIAVRALDIVLNTTITLRPSLLVTVTELDFVLGQRYSLA